MGAIGTKFRQIAENETENRLVFFCPGCKCGHFIISKGPKAWNVIDADTSTPSITPSILTGHDNFTKERCHSFITKGNIQFLDDCYHELKGQTVPLPDFH